MSTSRISVIVPVYNEKGVVAQCLSDIQDTLRSLGRTYEIIVVDDGSTDGTTELLRSLGGIKLIEHHHNIGYGASLKTGARHASYETLFFCDADGQHPPEAIRAVLAQSDAYDMTVGARQGYKGPWIRQPGKRLVTWVASYLVSRRIPDLNSGLRAVNRAWFDRFAHLYPNGFSLTTTTTLAFMKQGLRVGYVPIEIRPRIGSSSTVRPHHAITVVMLITRMIALFSPLRFFLPMSALILVPAMASFIYDVTVWHLSNTSVVLFVAAMLCLFFGIVLDQIAAIHRNLHVKSSSGVSSGEDRQTEGQ